jgi:hypothetical protein
MLKQVLSVDRPRPVRSLLYAVLSYFVRPSATAADAVEKRLIVNSLDGPERHPGNQGEFNYLPFNRRHGPQRGRTGSRANKLVNLMRTKTTSLYCKMKLHLVGDRPRPVNKRKAKFFFESRPMLFKKPQTNSQSLVEASAVKFNLDHRRSSLLRSPSSKSPFLGKLGQSPIPRSA